VYLPTIRPGWSEGVLAGDDDLGLSGSGVVTSDTLLHALREYEVFYNEHRPHQGITNARPLAPLPEPITDPDRLAQLNIHRRDRLGGILHEYGHAA
jgi:hypothetical protein